MNIRDPLIHATYFYLRETPADTAARREDRHALFVDEVRRMSQGIAGWLALPAPELPAIAPWSAGVPSEPQPLMPAQTLHGRTNASAVLRAFALRDMLLLRVILARSGEHDQAVWELLDAALGADPTAESWLHTARYWCGLAPRLPEELEAERGQPVRAPFGVLYLGMGAQAHILVYPDARTETRANAFLSGVAPRLDWYPVEARHRFELYADRAANAARQQQALDHVAQSAQTWAIPPARAGLLPSLIPLHGELDRLEELHRETAQDLTATYGDLRAMRGLAADYQAELMHSGLWSADPAIWAAQVARISGLEAQIEADVRHLETTLHRIEFLLHSLQTRVMVQQTERTRQITYLALVLAAVIALILLGDADLGRLLPRLFALTLIVLGAGAGWWAWRRRQRPAEGPADPR